MRKYPNLRVEKFRISGGGSGAGIFIIPPYSRSGFYTAELRVIASDAGGWDHISISPNAARCPTWDEMTFVKDLFFRDDEPAMQLHPPKAVYINQHAYVLHLWRPQTEEERQAIAAMYGDEPRPDWPTPGPIPMPPPEMV